MSDSTAQSSSSGKPDKQYDLFLGRFRGIPIPLRLIGGLTLLVLIGTGILLLPGMAVKPLSVMEAFFTSTSAVTVTGLSVVPTSTRFTLLGQVMLLALIQVGGIGFITLIVLAMHMLGLSISLTERLALTSALGLDKPGEILSILRDTIIAMFILEGIGALLLYLHWSINGIAPAGRVGFYALFHAVSAFCNAGFDLFSGLPAYPEGLPNDNITLIILGLLVMIGGLGIPVLMELTRWRRHKRMTLHTWLTLVTTAGLILLGWAGLFLAEYVRVRGVASGVGLTNALTQTWFQSVSTRTAGFPGLHSFSLVGPDSRLLIITLMFIGSGPASMGGGITTGTFAVLVLAAWNYARGFHTVQVRHRTIAQTTVARSLAVLLTFLAVVLIASWLILFTNSFSFNKVVFEVVSALATCGLSMGITDNLNTFGRLVIIAMMFFGRAGVVTLLLALSRREFFAKRYLTFPEEDVLVG